MKKRIAILGSTGSIGQNALNVIAKLPSKLFEVAALSADSNVKLLARQARVYRPRIVAVGDGVSRKDAARILPAGVKIAVGLDGLKEIVQRRDIDLVLFAIAGSVCLIPLVEAIKAKKLIALANKESIVSAGSYVMKLAKANNVTIVPVDSEHSAIFQCIDGKRHYLKKIYLTASGGPLLDIPRSRFSGLNPLIVLNHPRWKMGRKVTVDSATMMNKGLEIIEARWLFDVNEKDIEILVHPEAIVHSMVELIDGVILAQAALPDMRLPIQFALTYPERAKGIVRGPIFHKIEKLTFKKPDPEKFPCLELARLAIRKDGTYPAVLCAADEVAVKCFLDGCIKFSRIPAIIEKVMSRHRCVSGKDPELRDILDAELWAKEEAKRICCH